MDSPLTQYIDSLFQTSLFFFFSPRRNYQKLEIRREMKRRGQSSKETQEGTQEGDARKGSKKNKSINIKSMYKKMHSERDRYPVELDSFLNLSWCLFSVWLNIVSFFFFFSLPSFSLFKGTWSFVFHARIISFRSVSFFCIFGRDTFFLKKRIDLDLDLSGCCLDGLEKNPEYT